MKLYLIFCALLFLVSAVLFLLFPKLIIKISKWANRVLVYTDEKIYAIRKPVGIVLLLLAAFLTYIIVVF